MKKLQLPIAACELIPHQPPILMVDSLVYYENGSATVETILDPNSLFIYHNKVIEPSAMTEMIAQACAVMKGYEDRINEKAMKRGYLVAIQKMSVFGYAYANKLLSINVNTVKQFGDFSMLNGKITLDETVLAHGTLNVWISTQ